MSDTIVYGFASIYGSFEVCVFKGEEGSTRFWGFIATAYVNEDANVDVGGNGDWFREYSDSVAEFGGIVCERLWLESFAFWADGCVDGGSDDCFVAL